MRQPATTTINGVEYSCTQFDVKKSLRILTKLGKRVGKPLAGLISNVDDSKDLLSQDIKKINVAGAVEGLFSDMEEDELYNLCQDVCSSVIAKQTENTIGGKLEGDNFNMHFKGGSGLLVLFKVCKWALEVNYGDFLSAVVGSVSSRNPAGVVEPGSSTQVR